MKTAEMKADIIQDFRGYCDEKIRPFAGEFDEKECIPAELIKELGSKSYFAAGIPEVYHGLGLNPVEYGLFTEQAGKACCNIRTLLTVNSLVGESLLRYGTERQKEEWLVLSEKERKSERLHCLNQTLVQTQTTLKHRMQKTEAAMSSTAEKNGFPLTPLLTFSGYSPGWRSGYSLYCRQPPERSNGKKMEGMMANRASYLAEIEFDGVEVSDDQILGPIGGGFNYIVNLALDHGRYSVAWAGLAIAQKPSIL